MIRLSLIIPFLLVLVLFSASNQDSLSLWILTYNWKSSAGVLALVVAALAFGLGAFTIWTIEIGQRRRARRAEGRIRELEVQVATLTSDLSRTRALLPGHVLTGAPGVAGEYPAR